jgi:chemotaxis regulatin CheY-phosphate phosphatase CheZ
MINKVIQTDDSTKQIHSELKHLADSINQIIKGIKVAQEPIADSRKKVPQATEQLERITQQTAVATHRVLDMVEAITGREGEIESQIKELRRVLPSTYFRNNSRVKRIVEKIVAGASANQNDAYAIMDALQFQDITSQQVDHAISLLEQVEIRLKDVLVGLQLDSGNENDVVRKERAYDPNAHFSNDSNEQSKVDELLSNLTKEKQNN